MKARLSVDIGGTFTDVVLESDGRYTTTKVLTTYDDPARGVIQGIQEVMAIAEVKPGEVVAVLHGTTLATNALIERRGAVTGMLTTEGHRDVIEMAFENRFEQYDINIDRPTPLVPRYMRMGVAERMAYDGSVLRELDLDSTRRALDAMLGQGMESVAVCLLHSYANDHHEQAIAQLIDRQYHGLAVSLSSAVCPEIREYERFSTTTANAYVKPLMAKYLASLADQVLSLGVRSDILMMTSGGGLTTLATAAEHPIRLVESGPAGGAMLAAQLARDHGFDEVLSFDMGGTTAKICLIDRGHPLSSRAFEVDRSYRFKKGSGLPVRIPVIEMVEIGAGGGSIAHLDEMGRLHVGPQSAGSEPGPACYGRGGVRATVTDADVALGKLHPDHFAGDKFSLDVAAAGAALTADLAPLSVERVELAHAVNEIVEENMAAAARSHAAEWGRDLRGRCMFAFGGAAPLHAVGLARKLKINKVLIPKGAGVGSAIGFLRAPIRFEVVRSAVADIAALNLVAMGRMFNEMQAEASTVLTSAHAAQPWQEEISGYMRYAGQGYEIAVPVDRDLQDLRVAFEQAYVKLYGRIIPNMAVEVLSWTLSLSGPAAESLAPVVEPLIPVVEPSLDLVTVGHQPYFDGDELAEVTVQIRPQGRFEGTHAGPLILVEDQTTTVLPKDWQCSTLSDGALLLEQQT